jgi:hypothetical protein
MSPSSYLISSASIEKVSLHIISNHRCAHIASGATGDFDEDAIRVWSRNWACARFRRVMIWSSSLRYCFNVSRYQLWSSVVVVEIAHLWTVRRWSTFLRLWWSAWVGELGMNRCMRTMSRKVGWSFCWTGVCVRSNISFRNCYTL